MHKYKSYFLKAKSQGFEAVEVGNHENKTAAVLAARKADKENGKTRFVYVSGSSPFCELGGKSVGWQVAKVDADNVENIECEVVREMTM